MKKPTTTRGAATVRTPGRCSLRTRGAGTGRGGDVIHRTRPLGRTLRYRVRTSMIMTTSAGHGSRHQPLQR